eukprot:6202347-Pleurochrysis_carterae.AAC.3
MARAQQKQRTSGTADEAEAGSAEKENAYLVDIVEVLATQLFACRNPDARGALTMTTLNT